MADHPATFSTHLKGEKCAVRIWEIDKPKLPLAIYYRRETNGNLLINLRIFGRWLQLQYMRLDIGEQT